jgi:hypothetical protein
MPRLNTLRTSRGQKKIKTVQWFVGNDPEVKVSDKKKLLDEECMAKSWTKEKVLRFNLKNLSESSSHRPLTYSNTQLQRRMNDIREQQNQSQNQSGEEEDEDDGLTRWFNAEPQNLPK